MIVTIRNVAVFDGTTTLSGRHDVTFSGDTVTAVTPTTSKVLDGNRVDTTVVDGSGATLLPGLIDGHVHFLAPDEFGRLTSSGVTSAADMGTWPVEHVAALRAASKGFAFRTAGAPIIGPSGPHSHMPGLANSIITTPDQARRIVDLRAAEGVDYIKLVLEAAGKGGPDHDTAAAVVHAAHDAGLRVVAHASAVGAIELGIEIGVDILTHAPLDQPARPEIIDRIVHQRITVVPTLIMMQTNARNRGIESSYENARRFVHDLHAAGAVLTAGTDANAAPGAPATVRHGHALHDELQLLIDAGLTPTEALRTATSTAAAVFGWPDRGMIVAGSHADLLLVDGDPIANIAAIQHIRAVWLGGHLVDHE